MFNIKRLFTVNVLTFAAVAVGVAFVFTPGQSLANEPAKIAHGGLLYDKWYGITEGDLPRKTHKAYPKSSKKKRKTTWRCKECHGWDYQGAKGAYGDKKNSHYTGIKGISASAGADPAKIIATLKDKNHNYTDDFLTKGEFEALALFVSKGQVDMPKIISADGKSVKGDAKKGAAYYDTICSGCHGLDGKKINDMPPVGKVANSNPWETLHKVRNGQPGEKMPALLALPAQISIDIVAYTQTLTQE